MRKRREAFTIPLLIGREVWAPPAPAPRETGARGLARPPAQSAQEDEETAFPEGGGRSRMADFPVRRRNPWFVPPAGVRHPFPSRTRPLRPPAAMILCSRAGESSAARTVSRRPPGPPLGAGGLFFAPAGRLRGRIELKLCNIYSMMKRLVGAQVGCGAFAREQHLPNLAKRTDVRLKYCCDIQISNARRAAQEYCGERAVADFQEVVSDPEVDFLMVATPHDLHLPIVQKAAEYGKHVFCEKPMAMSISDSYEIIRLVKRSGIKFCVDLNRRMAPSMVALRERVLQQRSNPRHQPWRFIELDRAELPEEQTAHLLIRIQDESSSYRMIHLDPLHGGGQIIGEAVHWLDLACWFFAPARPLEITACGGTRLNHTIFLKFDNGDSATLDFSSCGTFDFPKELFEVTCQAALFRNLFFVENRYYGIPGVENECFPLQHDDLKGEVPEEGFEAYLAKVRARNRLAGGNLRDVSHRLVVDKGHENMLGGFLQAIREDSETPCNEYCGLQATLLAQLSIESIRRRVSLPVLIEELRPAIF